MKMTLNYNNKITFEFLLNLNGFKIYLYIFRSIQPPLLTSQCVLEQGLSFPNSFPLSLDGMRRRREEEVEEAEKERRRR